MFGLRTEANRGLPEDIKAYLSSLERSLRIEAIILFGSRAGENPHRRSDYDLLIIADQLAGDLWERQEVLWRDKPGSVDVIGLTPQEVKLMIHRGLILDALLQGKVLQGDISELRDLAHAHIRKEGLVRTAVGYVHG